MAIGTPVERKAYSAVENVGLLTFNPDSNVTQGTNAILIMWVGSLPAIDVDDSVGNTWAIDKSFYWITGDQYLVAASCRVATGITTTDTISVSMSAIGNYFRFGWVYEVSGLAASPFDKDANADSSGIDLSVGPTATLSQASEIAFTTSFPNGATTVTSMPGWTAATTNNLNGQIDLHYQIVATTDPVTATGTFNRGDRLWGAWVGTYEAASPSTAPQRLQPRRGGTGRW